MHDWGMMNWGWGGMVFQLLFWLVLIGIIIWGVKYFSKYGRFQYSTVNGGSALEILKKRYAKGEIDRKEYEEKKEDLL